MTHVAAALLQRLLPCRAQGPDRAVPFPAAGALACTKGVALSKQCRPVVCTLEALIPEAWPALRPVSSTQGSEATAAASSTMKKVLKVQCARHTTGGACTGTFRNSLGGTWCGPVPS